MTLYQIGCSTTNPPDGTAVGTPSGFQNPTTPAGTTRIWRTSVAGRANTGIQITAGGSTDAFRTVVFTGNSSVALTGWNTTPASTGVTKTMAVWRTASGVGFRLQWSASGELIILDTGQTVRVLAAAGVIANSTTIGFQSWVTQAGSGASKLHVLISAKDGSTIAQYDSDVVNLGTLVFTHFDFDPGGSAVVYGWSEIQYEDGRTSFIPFWSPGASLNLASSAEGSSTSSTSSAGSTTSTSSAEGSTTSARTSAGALALTASADGASTSSRSSVFKFDTSSSSTGYTTTELTFAGSLTSPRSSEGVADSARSSTSPLPVASSANGASTSARTSSATLAVSSVVEPSRDVAISTRPVLKATTTGEGASTSSMTYDSPNRLDLASSSTGSSVATMRISASLAVAAMSVGSSASARTAANVFALASSTAPTRTSAPVMAGRLAVASTSGSSKSLLVATRLYLGSLSASEGVSVVIFNGDRRDVDVRISLAPPRWSSSLAPMRDRSSRLAPQRWKAALS